MAESEVWAEKVERVEGRARKAIMSNGAVEMSFIEKDGKAIELPHLRTRPDKGTICDQERLSGPWTHYLKAKKMAAAILKERR
jgi:hypothetical protein